MALTSPIRYRPFSHLPGTVCLLPFSQIGCEVFPSNIRFFDMSGASPHFVGVIIFTNLGPLKQFCVMQDQERGAIIVSGFSRNGFVRYKILPQRDPSSWAVQFEKGGDDIELEFAHIKHQMQTTRKLSYTFYKHEGLIGAAQMPLRERLSLGVDKAQEWGQIVRRSKVREILPYWYWLAQSIVLPHDVVMMGSKASLFKNFQDAVIERRRGLVVEHIEALYLAGFSQLLVPQLEDRHFLGYPVPVADLAGSSLHLLEHTFTLQRMLFFEEIDASLHILPLLPPEFASGTLTDIKTSKGHKVSIEWTKHTIRQLLVEAASDDELGLVFDKDIKSVRHQTYRFDNPVKLNIRQGQSYLLDKFQK